MKITYDKSAGAVYISLEGEKIIYYRLAGEKPEVKLRTTTLSDSVNLDWRDGTLFGIEILNVPNLSVEVREDAPES